MIKETSIQEFTVSLRGELILPEHAGYEEARKIYNAMIDRRPSMILRCADVADVISAVNFGRENGMLTAIRGGGHSGAGLCLCDDGLVIDVSPLKYVRVDPTAQTVRVGAGCTLGDVDHATQPFGLAVPAGVFSTTGVPGLTLGGGHGYLTRKYGLTIDNLISADVVLADGRFVTASEKENSDLFWALRGGGGNFGVVTSFLFRGRPVGTIYGGPTLWDMDRAAEVLRWYRDFSLQASEDLYGFFAFLKVPPGPPFPEKFHFRTMCGIVWCYLGPLEQAEEVFAPVKDLEPTLPLLHEMPFQALQTAFDPLLPPGLQWYWKGDFVKEISDQAVDVHVKHGARLPSLLSTMHIYPIDGAAQRVGKNDTAFSYRDANWSMVIAGVDPDPGNAQPITAWAKDYWQEAHPYSAGGAYVNFMMEEGHERVKDTYRDNYDRLVEVKTKYDPENLFRVNQNIKPRPRS
jgi:FAD/FMN-containing dehydrogenase